MPKLTESFERWTVWVDRSHTGDKSGFDSGKWDIGPTPILFSEERFAISQASVLRKMCIAGHAYKVVRVLVTLEEV